MHKITLNEFKENSDINYYVTVAVNGDEVDIAISGNDFDSVAEEWHKIENTVNEVLEEQYQEYTEGIRDL